MRAAVTVGPCRAEVCDLPEPEPAPDEVLLQVAAVGLCGTDLHMWAGERAGVGFPLRQGHEIGATVQRLPADGSAAHLSVGDVVAVNPSVPCGRCRACARGEWPACPAFSAYGVARPGGLAERMAVPAAQLHRVDGVPPEVAALVEPVSVAAMALHRCELRAGDRLAVLGAGPIGLALVLCAQAAGVRVLITDPLPARLALALRLGAELAVGVTARSVEEAVGEWTGGEGADAVVEASGSPRAAAGALGMVGRGGRLVVVGLGTHELSVPVSRLLFDGVQVRGARGGLFPEAVAVVHTQPEAVTELVSHRFPLAQVQAAFQQAHDDPGGTVKVLVRLASCPGVVSPLTTTGIVPRVG